MHTLSVKSQAIPVFNEKNALVPVKLTGSEGINTLFEYQLICKTADDLKDILDITANFDRQQFIGKTISIGISTENHLLDGNETNQREINGIITNIAFVKREARNNIYQITISPWLYQAKLRKNSKIYQDLSAPEILNSLLGSYFCSTDFKLLNSYPSRDYLTQFNESDFDFFSRICEEYGINYFFEHKNGDNILVLIDSMESFQQCQLEQYKTIPFHDNDSELGIEYIKKLSLENNIVPNKFYTSDYDYTNPNADLSVHYQNDQENYNGTHEIYSWGGSEHFAQPKKNLTTQNDDQYPASSKAYYKDTNEENGKSLAIKRARALECKHYIAKGYGEIRGVISGFCFNLTEHPNDEANIKWLVINSHLQIEETNETTTSKAKKNNTQIQCHFEIYPASKIFLPTLITNKPISYGPEIAIVECAENNEIWTDQLGRIKVRFLWDRYHNAESNNSCWIRLSTIWAGNQLGSMHLPRKGQEVLINFIGGNPDLPICTGQVYNSTHLPPWDLPSQKALSGFKSAELNHTGRTNYLLMDDTSNGIQTQLGCDHFQSKLSLGFITHIEKGTKGKVKSTQAKDSSNTSDTYEVRGEGFELRTYGEGSIRASKGIMITTGSDDPAKDKLNSLKGLEISMGQVLFNHHHPKCNDPYFENTNRVSKALSTSIGIEIGLNTANHLNSDIVISSNNVVNILSGSSTHINSGSVLTISSANSTSMSIGGAFIASVADLFTLFVKAKDYIVSALKGKIILTAHENDIQLLANKEILLQSKTGATNIDSYAEMKLAATKDLNIVSTEDCIYITANKRIVINGGGSSSQWDSKGIEHFTSGIWKEHAKTHLSVSGQKKKTDISDRKAIEIKTPSELNFLGIITIADALTFSTIGTYLYNAATDSFLNTSDYQENEPTDVDNAKKDFNEQGINLFKNFVVLAIQDPAKAMMPVNFIGALGIFPVLVNYTKKLDHDQSKKSSKNSDMHA